ncbi:MAG: transcription termination factor Rho [Acidimicrobiales bacterium]|nr:transcription termination factor Rho [Acidimicrobiales bacterium]
MSTDNPALERSVLERKDREELAAIAEAMGTKPASRASKATIINAILREAGIESGDDQPKRSRAKAADKADAPAVDASSSNGSDAPAPAAPAVATETPAPAAVASANGEGQSATPTVERPADGGGQGGGGQGGGGQQQNRGQQQTRDRDNRGNRQGGGQGGGGQGSGGQGGGGQGGFDAEPGNRRSRRRRGRDRERGGQGGGGGGEREFQGQGGAEQPYTGELIPAEGLLDLRDEGYGFLRAGGYTPGQRDVYVSLSQARRFALRKGDVIVGANRPANSNEKYPALVRIDTVNGMTPDDARNRPRFEDLTPLFPDERLRLEVPGDTANMVARIVDLISPIGKGQRGLIVSPPKAGKTTVLKQIAHSIEANNPDVHLIVLLVDERPEEVTDMRRSVKGEVVASTFDRPSDEHTQIAELVIERARRLVEMGRDVVIVLDGITRLARAYNLAQPASGRIMSGGVDSGALYPPKKFFGSARNIEEGGSLTILATALVETGSKMDEVIFEEFKGTGNMELRLDRKLSERRIYPAIEVNASSTRHEELLFERNQLQQVWKLRRVLNALAADGSGAPGLELLMDKIKTTNSNDEFLAEIAKAPVPGGA